MLEPFESADGVQARFPLCVADPAAPGAMRRLYAAAAREWVAAGRGTHVLAAAYDDRVAIEALTDLGFGRGLALAIAPVEPSRGPQPSSNLRIRQAIPDDRAAVRQLGGDLWRSFSESPVLMPFLPGTLPDLEAHADRYLADPASPVWIAERDGEIIALQVFLTPESGDWFLGPPVDSQSTIYLFWASTAAAARGAGIQSALLDHTMRWASHQGYAAMALHYLSSSFASEFWQRHGFRPVFHSMIRRIDPRSLATVVS
jgi:GNAT superfamily N-acetyltransferase